MRIAKKHNGKRGAKDKRQSRSQSRGAVDPCLRKRETRNGFRVYKTV